MMDDEFEWHSTKAEINAKSHGITFELACDAFKDGRAIWTEDLDSSWEEDRFRVVGMAHGRIIAVTYTYRDGDVIRLISARAATKRERNDYNRGKSAT